MVKEPLRASECRFYEKYNSENIIVIKGEKYFYIFCSKAVSPRIELFYMKRTNKNENDFKLLLNGNLFTGKCGYMWRNDWKILILILIINLFSGYFFGFLCRWLNPALIELAIVKISSWEVSFSYFLKFILLTICLKKHIILI